MLKKFSLKIQVPRVGKYNNPHTFIRLWIGQVLIACCILASVAAIALVGAIPIYLIDKLLGIL